MVHLIRWACFFITLLLSLILIVLFLYELQGSLWLRSIKVIGQCAFFMSFGWADSAGSSPLRRLGDQTPVAPTITSRSITELWARENSGGGSYMRNKTHKFESKTEKSKKKNNPSKVCVLSSWLRLGSVHVHAYVWLWNIFGVWLKTGLIKQMSQSRGAVTGVPSRRPKWNKLCQSSLTEAPATDTHLESYWKAVEGLTYPDTCASRHRKTYKSYSAYVLYQHRHIEGEAHCTRTKTSANAAPAKTHRNTHTLTSYPALHAKPVSLQVV